MDHNLLLAYLTELGSGTWTKFRHAIDHLAGEDENLLPSLIARHLSMLGHVEFAFFDDMRWTVCPPTLACLPNKNGLVAVLCGGRSQHFLELINKRAEELGIRIQYQSQQDGPDAIYVTGSSNDLGKQLASQLELMKEENPAEHIIRCLPSIEAYLPLCVEAWEPTGYAIKLFDPDLLKWTDVTEVNNDGLYRYENFFTPEYLLKIDNRLLKTTRGIGMYLLLKHKRRNVLHYDSSCAELKIPAIARLPLLHAKALTLCSGLLPTFEKFDATHIYREIPENLVRTMILKLGQH